MASPVILGTFAAGSIAYWGFFKRGEHFLRANQYWQGFAISVFAGAVFLSQQNNIKLIEAIANSLRLGWIFLAGVYANCLFFRLFLNPLNSFPGPYAARITKLDHVVRNRKFDAHIKFLESHRQYGDFLRIGPNDLSVVDVKAVEVISAANTKCTKGPWYQQDWPLMSLHTTRDRALHDRRRRIWAPAFSDKSLRGYETRVQTLNDLLISKLDETKGNPVDATNLLNLYSFDTMGDLAFGRDFGMLQGGEVHWAIKLLNAGMDPLALELPHWLFRFLSEIPGAAAGYWKFIGFCTEALEKRIKGHDKVDPDKPDITHNLIEHYNKSDNKKDLYPMLCGDSRLIIVAGSDTTAATLSYLTYHLASKPEWQKKLRTELQNIKRDNKLDGTVFPDQILKECDLLNGLIDETLRLNPPVPSGVFRRTPPEGINIGSTYIPGNTNIQMPMYVMSRSEKNWVRPEEFLPERWYSKPELIKEKDAFQPFSSGPYGCIGKNLAYMEIRTVMAQLVDQFDISLAPGETGKKLLMETTDHFTLGLQPLMTQFKRR